MSAVLSREWYRLLRPSDLEPPSYHIAYEKLRPREAEGLAWTWGEWQSWDQGSQASAQPGSSPAAPQRAECHLRAGLHQRRAHLVHGQLHHHGGPPARHPAPPGVLVAPPPHPGRGARGGDGVGRLWLQMMCGLVITECRVGTKGWGEESSWTSHLGSPWEGWRVGRRG